MLSQRLAKAAQQASQGNPVAFKQLRESRDEFAGLVTLLSRRRRGRRRGVAPYACDACVPHSTRW